MNFVEQPITETLEQNFMPYAMSIIISRAIPEIDGFKPSHRKLLYTMYKMGLLSGNRTKSANVVGQTMKLNPHGDGAIYETLVRLTEGNAALLHPYIDSKGNFGKQYSRDMAYAASRYTEVKLTPICADVFGDIDKDAVDFVDNYDGSLQEPVLLPVKYPSILVNSNQGIAVGMASNMCSFNLKEICDTTVAFLKNPRCDLSKTLLAPDFTTGGDLLYNKAEMDEIYRTGRGSIKVRAKYTYDKKNNCIDISEIPYTTTVEAIIDKIIDLIKQNKIREIADLRDETDLKGLKITLDLKRGTDADKLMTKLFKMTPLQDSFGCNFNVIIGNTPKVLGVAELLGEWVSFRMDCIRRQITFDLGKKTERLHLLQGLEKILLDIDKAIRIIRETEKESDVLPNLMQGFGVDEAQAEFIAEIRLRNLNKEYILKRVQDIESLIDDLARLRALLGDEGKIKELIAGQVKEIAKKYGKPRLTNILAADQAEEYVETEQIEDYNVKLFATQEGYLKKISHVSLRSAGEQKLKDGDAIIREFDTVNRSEVLVFSDRATVYKVKTYDIADCKASQMGEYLPTMLGMEDGERVAGVVVTSDYSGFVLFAFENGKMTKVNLSAYATKTNRKKLANAYSGASPLVQLLHSTEDIDIALLSTIDKILVCNTKAISLKSTRDSQGIAVMTLKKAARLKAVLPAEQLHTESLDYYRTKNIPAVGCFSKDTQTSLF